jgi:hypothetical protein
LKLGPALTLSQNPLFEMASIGAERDRIDDLMTAGTGNKNNEFNCLSSIKGLNLMNHNKSYEIVKAKCTPSAP